jgi:tetratricopeptide (TPR) repeat protein
MSLEMKEFFFGDFFKYQILDNNEKSLGQINDILLRKDLSISKFIIYDLFGKEALLIDSESIEQEKEENFKFLTTLKKSDLEYINVNIIIKDEEMILYSIFKKKPIFDVNHQLNPNKIVNIAIKGICKKISSMIILEKGFLIKDVLVRNIRDEINLTISNSALESISAIPEESIQLLLISPEEKLEKFKKNPTEWSIINQLIELGHIEITKSFLEQWKTSGIAPEQEQVFYYHLGKIYEAIGEYNQSISVFNKSLSKDKEKKNTLLLGRCYTQLGKSFIMYGLLDKGFGSLKKAKELLEYNIKYSLYRSITLNWIGTYYYLKGMINKALDIYNKALDISEYFGNPKISALSLNNIGMIYLIQGKLEKSIEIYKKAIDILRGNYPRTLATIIRNEAIAVYELGMQGKSLEKQFDALHLREKIGYQIDIADSVLNIIRIEHSMGKLTNSSSILARFPENPFNLHLISTYKYIINGLLAKINSKWMDAIQNWKLALEDSSLEFSYQVWIFEYICEVMLLKWKEMADEETFAQLGRQAYQAIKLTTKNKLFNHLSKSNIILAKLALYSKDFDEANRILHEILIISEERELKTHKYIIQKELDKLPKLMQNIDSIGWEEYQNKIVKEMLLYIRNLRIINLF